VRLLRESESVADDQAKRLQRLQRLAQRVTEADTRADELRAQLRQELADARAAGISIAAIARALGVSRQRVQQILKIR
jgi:DNA invertase Pin-like site-specific DNA recombinase